MNDYLNIGLIQPVIDPDLCWNETQYNISKNYLLKDNDPKNKLKPYRLNIDEFSAERVWGEIKEGLRLLIKGESRPDIILIPELHLPNHKINELKVISKKNNVMIISGIDFSRNPINESKIRNRGIITIPNNWSQGEISNLISSLNFGKTYFTYMEKNMFQNIEGKKCFEDQEQNMYIFKTKKFGNFGIMICSDFFDIERMMLYQTQIHHLFIISLNKDLNSYFSMADALTRLLYCNVVICNTGHFGGSYVVSPLHESNDRTIFKYLGQKMFNLQTVKIPVKSLDKAQKFDFAKEDKKAHGIKFKASPPGYFDKLNSKK